MLEEIEKLTKEEVYKAKEEVLEKLGFNTIKAGEETEAFDKVYKEYLKNEEEMKKAIEKGMKEEEFGKLLKKSFAYFDLLSEIDMMKFNELMYEMQMELKLEGE